MNERVVTISEAKKELAQLPKQFEAGLDIVTVTRYGKPIMTILPSHYYQALRKTIDKLQEISKNSSSL